jgi:hypothetical protein
MGTSLTGLTPATTYDALIKVGDNGPLSATAKVLSDGLGNDSPLAMSTTLVGIGTASPVRKLTVSGADDGELQLRLLGNASTNSYAELGRESMSTGQFRIKLSRNGTVITPLVIDDQSGNVGIGTIGPARALHVKSGTGTMQIESTSTASNLYLGDSSSTVIDNQGIASSGNSIIVFTGGLERIRVSNNGLSFNGDTAAANALDDYEEGTFTATMTGTVSNPTTPVTTTGTYTKIGRQVTVNVIFDNVNTTGAAGGVRITGLPFSCGFTGGVGAVILELFDFTAGRTSVASYVNVSSPTTIFIEASGSNSSFGGVAHSAGAGRYLYTSLTYFV